MSHTGKHPLGLTAWPCQDHTCSCRTIFMNYMGPSECPCSICRPPSTSQKDLGHLEGELGACKAEAALSNLAKQLAVLALGPDQ